MKSSVLIYPAITACLALSTSAFSSPFKTRRVVRLPDQQLQSQEQRPIMGAPDVGIPLPPSDDDSNKNLPPSGNVVMISDVIGGSSSINIFAGFTRDIDSISKRLDDSSQNATVLAPLNGAIMKLPRKPWEDPKDYEQLGSSAYEGAAGEDRAHRNLRRFVEAHVVPESPWKASSKMEALAGNQVWWEEKDGKKVIQPGNIPVVSVANTVANGEVWILEGVLNYA